MRRVVQTRLALAFLLTVSTVQAQRFKPDDPLWQDPDRILSIPGPTDRPLSKTIDLFQKTFIKPEEGQMRAQNINTLGEVPDSSWFTNRMSRRVMTIDELVRGADRSEGPDMSVPWTIIGAKTEGDTPGFRMRDGRGDVYFIKFDPLYWPQMATSAEVIGTKFYYAFGYNTPENYLVYWRPEHEIDQQAEVLWDSGHVERLSEAYVKDVLEAVPRRSDGTVQVLASKFLPGRPVGPFDFQGTRSDDPNDIFLHQDRRELRALRIFAAWLNHNDSDSLNTLDMYDTDGKGNSYVRHYLIDFGTVMGSGAHQPHARRVGNEYYIEFKPALKAAATLGIWDRPWRHLDYPEYKSVGRFESKYFQPHEWKPDYPNPAFDKMQPEDVLWATRTVMRFSDEAIRAIVKTGQIDDAEAENYVVATLIERRDKIVRHYLAESNPLDGFELVERDNVWELVFKNLGIEAGLAARVNYTYQWHRFDNQTEQSESLGAEGTSTEPKLALPRDQADFLMVRISTSGLPQWKQAIDVYLSMGSTEPSVVGIERSSVNN